MIFFFFQMHMTIIWGGVGGLKMKIMTPISQPISILSSTSLGWRPGDSSIARVANLWIVESLKAGSQKGITLAWQWRGILGFLNWVYKDHGKAHAHLSARLDCFPQAEHLLASRCSSYMDHQQPAGTCAFFSLRGK